MACRIPVALLLLVVLGTLLGADAYSFVVHSGSLKLTIIRAEIKMRDRVAYWEVNTPIYHEDPYFEVEVQTAGMILVAERDPQNRSEILPPDWKPGVMLKGHVDKRHLYLERPDGTEMRFIIIRRKKISE